MFCPKAWLLCFNSNGCGALPAEPRARAIVVGGLKKLERRSLARPLRRIVARIRVRLDGSQLGQGLALRGAVCHGADRRRCRRRRGVLGDGLALGLVWILHPL